MDATIKEGNVGRSFSPVDKLKINLQNDGGESLWVPEDSVQLDELYTSTNGTYYAAPRDIYGWGVVTVDVDNSIDEPDDLYDDDEDQEEEQEENWYFIDPDTDDQVDIKEDENGWYFIDPDTGDRVDIEEDDDGWYFIDPDTGERVDIEEDEDGNPYFIDPDTGNRIDIEWDGEGEKPDNPWSPHSGGGGGGDDEDQDDDSWDDWDDEPDEDWDEDGDEGDEEDEDDWGDDDEDWDEEGDDEDDSITDGDDYDYIDDDGNLVEEDCPASIQVMHVPNTTEYTDGWAINYDGLVVQAFDADGNVWSSSDYPDGYIPVHKLNLPKYSDIAEADANVEVPDYAPINNADSVVSIGSIIDIFQDHFPDNISEAQKEAMRDGMSGYVSDAAISYAWCDGNLPPAGTSMLRARWTGCVVITGQPGEGGLCDAVRYSWGLSYYQSPLEGGSTIFSLNGPRIENIRINLFQGYEEETGLLSNANASILNYSQPIDVEWESPCLNTLSSSFEITVNKREDHGGSHHSGKF